ncbi:type II secretion system F family protein [Arthrobacter sp. NA-172]|uniref:type II secretion system F family protein n=1 Tax=Arthrobacter sp. NA-172 TaxID=3367524 RepID=UPI0037551F28
MTGFLAFVLATAVWVTFQPSRRRAKRVLRALTPALTAAPVARMSWRRAPVDALPLTVLVQQLAALLRGGRSPSRLWEELWMVHGDAGHGVRPGGSGVGRARSNASGVPKLPSGSVRVLAAARAASIIGTSVAAAIRTSVAKDLGGGNSLEQRIWGELAACLDVAEASGCPLADVLTRFASQLEAEDDAGDARQTALAGPKATVRLLTWLPLFGLGLGVVLGVDPLRILLGNGIGIAALVAGVLLTVAGRIWSSRLVHAAAGVD